MIVSVITDRVKTRRENFATVAGMFFRSFDFQSNEERDEYRMSVNMISANDLDRDDRVIWRYIDEDDTNDPGRVRDPRQDWWKRIRNAEAERER